MSSKVLAPLKFSKARYRFWYEKMLLMRRFEEKVEKLYQEGQMQGFCHLYQGQEACLAGAISALRLGDKYITGYRDHVFPIALGVPPAQVFAELLGKATGLSQGRGGSMHLFSKAHHLFGGHAIVGAQLPLGVGIAFAERYRKSKYLCITYLGDGAVRQGSFHEALNLASLYRLPILFVIENNGYAMGTSVARSGQVTELHRLGASYAIPGKAVDGMSVEAVHTAIADAAPSVRKGNPLLLELKTYRYRGHSMADPATYRTREEVKDHKAQDPIEQLKNTLLAHQLITLKGLDRVARKIDQLLTQALEEAMAGELPGPDTVYDCVYSQPHYPFLQN